MDRTLVNLFFAPSLQRVHVDLNAITAEGLIRVRYSRFQAHVRCGEVIQIYEPIDGVEGLAHVARINERTGLVYLDIEWQTLRDLEPLHAIEVVNPGGMPPAPVVPAGRPRIAFASA